MHIILDHFLHMPHDWSLVQRANTLLGRSICDKGIPAGSKMRLAAAFDSEIIINHLLHVQQESTLFPHLGHQFAH
jgi:hypothetical protein